MMIKNVSRADLHLGELHSPGSLLHRSPVWRAGERRDEQEVKNLFIAGISHVMVILSAFLGFGLFFFFPQFARFISACRLTTLQQVSYPVNVHSTFPFSFSSYVLLRLLSQPPRTS